MIAFSPQKLQKQQGKDNLDLKLSWLSFLIRIFVYVII